MTTLREAAQMALDSLEKWPLDTEENSESVTRAIEALRAALAQPEQEPVAWITGGGKGELWWHQSEKFDTEGNLIGKNQNDIPLYTTPPQREWQGLTPEDKRMAGIPLYTDQMSISDAFDVIERILKEKNT